MFSNLSREFRPNGTSLVITFDSWKFLREHTLVPHLRRPNLIVHVQTNLARSSMHTRSTLVAKSSISLLKNILAVVTFGDRRAHQNQPGDQEKSTISPGTPTSSVININSDQCFFSPLTHSHEDGSIYKSPNG